MPLNLLRYSIMLCLVAATATRTTAADHPLSADQRAKMTASFDKTIAELSKQIESDPENLGHYSRRGDAYFFRAEFKKAVADYEKMVELNPNSAASHWRRGIAYFYADQFKQAAHQFEIYNTFDDVDRENGIWRFFSQSKAYGAKQAREGLLKYKKDDREPFPAVYQLFALKITPDEILKQIDAAKIDDDEREKRLFYAHLYIGLNHAVDGKPKLAEKHLAESVANKWGPRAGFGPNYMWHVGRLQYDVLTAKPKKTSGQKPAE